MSNGYKNGANIIIVDPRHGHILAVQHNYGEQKWALPGGGVEENERTEDGVIRETFEETGMLISEISLVARFQQRKPGGEDAGEVFLYETDMFSGNLETSHPEEIKDVKFINPHEIFFGRHLFGLGYKRMVAQWMRCSRGIDKAPFVGRLSNTVEIRCRGKVLSI